MVFTNILLSLSLAVDSFLVSLALSIEHKQALSPFVKITTGILFGVSQMTMIIIGWRATSALSPLIEQYQHWIAFLLLFGIGLDTLRTAFKDEARHTLTPLSTKTIILLAFATSIDSLAIGFSLPTITEYPLLTIAIIATVTTLASWTAFFGTKYVPIFLQKYAEFIGAGVLLFLACKILFSHYFL